MSRRISSDRVWKALVLKLTKRPDPHVKVGILSSKGGGDTWTPGPRRSSSPPRAPATITIVELAAIHEFGSPAAGIPERSFIRRTFKEKQPELAKVTAKLARKLVTDDAMTTERALGLLGAWGAAQVKRTITTDTGVPPPLAAATIKRKGSTRPLVDTGRMINAITWKVEVNG